MVPMASDSPLSRPVEGPWSAAELEARIERLVDRLRTLAVPRLVRIDPESGCSIAEQVHGIATAWARIVHGSGGPVPPVLGAEASGDLLAVLGREVVQAWDALTADQREQVEQDVVALRRAT
jgi:hypothetical protein